MWKLMAVAGMALGLCAAEPHPILPVGSPAPDFALPGVDGQIHKLADYAASPVLVVVFTCNHCPIAQMYESRIAKLRDDYLNKGVAVVAIQGNAPEAIRVDELDSSDVSDSLAEMKIRAAYKHLTYPYLYDGDTQAVTRACGPQATPHVFVFDRGRRLRYEGRMDDSYRAEMVKTHDARDAIDAVLAGKPVAVAHTGVFGCSTKWKEKEAARVAAIRKIESRPVTLETVSARGLKDLLTNRTGKTTLVSIWSTGCEACVRQLAGIETTYRMYSDRDVISVTVAANRPEERAAAQAILEKEHASGKNVLFGSTAAALRSAFDPDWNPAAPYTAVLSPEGKMLYRKIGEVDLLELRRKILADLPSDYIGFNRYWAGQK